MLYKIGTEKEVASIESLFPTKVTEAILTGAIVRDSEYGENRDYIEEGGYSIIVETISDLRELKKIIDYDTHPCEWAVTIPKDTGYICALYILNDDYTIDVFMPLAIAPEAILEDLED